MRMLQRPIPAQRYETMMENELSVVMVERQSSGSAIIVRTSAPRAENGTWEPPPGAGGMQCPAQTTSMRHIGLHTSAMRCRSTSSRAMGAHTTRLT